MYPRFAHAPIFSYCIAFLRKIKEIFAAERGFFAKPHQLSHGDRQDAPGQHHGLRPKLPHSIQVFGEHAEKQHHAACRTQQDIQPKLTIALAQQKQPKSQGRGKTISTIQQPQKPRTALTHRTQKIIHQRDAHAQQDRAGKEHQLLRNVIFHINRTAGAAGRRRSAQAPRRSGRQCGHPHAARRRPVRASRYAAPPR